MVGSQSATTQPAPVSEQEDLFVTQSEVGTYGGGLVVAQRTEPKTLNPVFAVDNASREVIRRMMADLIHINRETQRTEPALAKSWRVSPDGRRYTLELRRGIRFSDGHPLDADDIVFTFQMYLDEKLSSPQRDLLIVGGEELRVRKVDTYTVVFELAQPYGAAERLFDSIAILPQHKLEGFYQDGTFAQAWSLPTPPEEIVGLGPFRPKEYVPGQYLRLERNPYYWKVDREDQRLPYLDQITFLFVASADAEVLRFQAGESDVIGRMSAENFAVLEAQQPKQNFRLSDLGPGLDFNFIFFNLNDLGDKNLPELARKQEWFRKVGFRRAISAAVDRDSIVNLVYHGRGTPLWGNVTPGNKLWLNPDIPKERFSLERARELLREAGFSWNAEGDLVDAEGHTVEFSIISSASNAQRMQMATIIQEDLRKLGMRVQVVPFEFRALLDRLFQTYNYEACLLGLGGGDADPNPQMSVWLSSGGTHLWHLGQEEPATDWEAEIDQLLQQQLTTVRHEDRKRLYDRVQYLIAENLPVIFIANPNILVGAKTALGNFRPAILDHYTLWNVEELFWRKTVSSTHNEE